MTPAFQRWFGESAVVDEQGIPRIVYHGTTAKPFDIFRPYYRTTDMLGFGMHFSEERELAEMYAHREGTRRRGKHPRVLEVYLSVQRPLYADTIVVEGTPEFELAQKLAGKKLWDNRDEKGRRIAYLQNAIDLTGGERAGRLIQEAGYDGVRYKAEVGNFFGFSQFRKLAESISWIVFEPNQIKLVSNLEPTGDPDMRQNGKKVSLFGHKERWLPGEKAWFEYRCLESDESGDAPAWLHSHQQVEVLSDRDCEGREAGLSFLERDEEGWPDSYRIRFSDGLEWDAYEDELLTSKRFFEREDPPRENGSFAGTVHPIHPDDPDLEDMVEDAERIARSSTINILRDKQLSQVAVLDGEVVGAGFSSNLFYGEVFSFDVVVTPEAHRKGAGLALVKALEAEYYEACEAYDLDLKLAVHVVDDGMMRLLSARGYVKEWRGRDLIMKLPPRQNGRQEVPYGCGPAALQTALAQFGIFEKQSALGQRMGTSPEEGTPPRALVAEARRQGLQATQLNGASFGQVAAAVRRGAATILNFQAWPDEGTRLGVNALDGHYAVVKAVEGSTLLLEDPSADRPVTLTEDELMSRWYDQGATGKTSHLAIILEGEQRKASPLREMEARPNGPVLMYRGTQGTSSEATVRKSLSFTPCLEAATIYSAMPGDIWAHREPRFLETSTVHAAHIDAASVLRLGNGELYANMGEVLRALSYGEPQGIQRDEVKRIYNYLHNRLLGRVSGGEFKYQVFDEEGERLDPEDDDLVPFSISNPQTIFSVFREEMEFSRENEILERASGLVADTFIFADAPAVSRVAQRLGFRGISYMDLFEGAEHAAPVLLGREAESIECVEMRLDLESEWQFCHETLRPLPGASVEYIWHKRTA